MPDKESSNRATEIVQSYLSAVRAEQSNAEPLSMDVDIDANIPKLRKHGRLHALRHITRLGQIFYHSPHYEGDNTVKKEIIGRYLQAELQAQSGLGATVAITPDNYKFKFVREADYVGTPAYVLELTPKAKRVGLFQGELWLDQKTYLPLREWGVLVKTPSVFLKSVYFVRDYCIYDGRSIPRRLISDVDTRLVGRAEMTIWYDHYKVGEQGMTAESSFPEAAQAGAADGGVRH
ncbi:MAG: hypothetical protein ABSG25_03705 [Bryobacteraceae bacterium]|jgi:hypothetical protein